MLKLILCEFRKLRRKKLFHIAFLTTFIMPVFYALLLKGGDLDSMMSTVREENGFMLLIPLSIVVAANLFFEEHDYDTLKNLMCVPVAKGRLAMAKMLVLLIFDFSYMLVGFVAGILLSIVFGAALDGWGLQLFITICTSILLWAAAMPCLLVVVWCNKSYIISVIIAFTYMVAGYLMHISEKIVMVPLGLNIPTFLPIPVIFRWLYQYHPTVTMSKETLDFYGRFQPYFVSTPVVFAILMTEAAVCMVLMVKVYQRQKV